MPPIDSPRDRATAATSEESAVLAALDADGMLACLRDLVAIPSVTGAEEPAQAFVADRMRRLGMDVDVWELPLDELRRHPAYSAEVERTTATGVVGAWGEDAGGRTLILNGHVDVVPAGDEGLWSRPPFDCVVEDGHVWGRGALDMKGGLCCALYAVDAVRRAGVRLSGRVLVQSVVGEEDGGVGTLGAVLRGYRADGAIVMEPTRLAVAPAQAGALNFRLTVPGRSAHGAVRTEGVSALEKFIPIHDAILRLEAERNRRLRHPAFPDGGTPFPICIGTVRAGNWASNVPESLVCEGRYGVAPGEPLDQARGELEAVVAAAAAADPWLIENPPILAWWGGQFEPAEIAVDHPLADQVGAALRSLGREPAIEGMPFGADMRLLVNHADTPTLMFGPGDIRLAHRPDERVPVDDLLTVARALALVIVRFCGG